jgi:Na+-transporting NADH:ubiquinone oxidoreductase subunit A
MTPVLLKKGYDLNLLGSPSADLATLQKPPTVALLPERIPFIKPRLAVQEGDAVRIGTVLFTDKRDPRIRFVSPGAGRVTAIHFGPRRVIREIVIVLDEEEVAEIHEPVSADGLEAMPTEDLVEKLLAGGVWPFLRTLPFREIASPDVRPPRILVGIDSREPFQPDPEAVFTDMMDLLELGLTALRRLSPSIVVHASYRAVERLEGLDRLVTHEVRGPYPADDPGVVLYHTRRDAGDNRSWFLSGQDLLAIAGFLAEGRFPVERTVAISGTCAKNRHHVRCRLGAPLGQLIGGGGSVCASTRVIAGGVLTGYAAAAEGHLGLYETSVSLIPEPTEKEFLGSFQPGFQKPSYSRTFLSYWNPRSLAMNTNRSGGLRACIACGFCANVCPVDIWPQMTLKAILAGEVEEYLAHGLLDCVECGLCSYVCPSKIELTTTFRSTRRLYHKEQSEP